MVRYNFEFAYLTRKNGVLYIKQTGLAENRIDTVHITIDDNKNSLFIEYNDLKWAYNETTLDYYWSFENSDNITYSSIIKPENVHPDYLEEYIEKRIIKSFFKKNKIIETKVLLPKNGAIRLNQLPERVTINTVTKWDIEVLREKIEGNLYQTNPIL